MAMLDMLIQLRQNYGHVRYIGTGDDALILLCLLVKWRQRYGHVRFADTAETKVYSS
jgi:aryl carrier-like protein